MDRTSAGFPRDFWWGTGNSSHQCEGVAPASSYVAWERDGRLPPSGTGNDFSTRYADDFGLIAGLGLRHFRLSLEWARLEPEPGRNDMAEVERYREILQSANDHGVNVWVCAHHFTLPAWVDAMGSFLNDEVRTQLWPRHIAFLAEQFGDLVYGWKPINEPYAYAATGWMTGRFPPGVKDLRRGLEALKATHLANWEAWRVIKGDKPVATIQNLSPVFPASERAEDGAVARLLDDVTYGCWIRMVRDGVLRFDAAGDLAPPAVENPDFADAFDVIGFSYYAARSARYDADRPFFANLRVGNWPLGAEAGEMGYVAWPPGLKLVLDRLHADLPGKPLLVSEYGLGTNDDTRRQQYLRDGIAIARDAIATGVNLKGFFHWTSVDNYEWAKGYTVPFGLIDRDRQPRPSAAVIAEYATAP